MKKYFLILSLAFFAVSVFAQPVMKISASEHDFGKFREEAGKQKFDFVVMNTGDQPLVIKNIVASCGCTMPEWTKSPIGPKSTGTITAIYDPANRPGTFSKTLSVYTNSKPEVTVIVLKGEVIPREKTVEELFMFPVGSVRFESNHLAFTNVKKTERKIRTMQVINTSNQPAKIEFENVPPHLTIKANPVTLKPGQKGLIEGTYDATKNQSWGYTTDMLRIKVNDGQEKNVYYAVSANLVEDFSGLTKEEIANAPVFGIDSKTFNLGRIQGSTANNVEFKFTNNGKSDLVIRYIKASCGCTALQQGVQGQAIKPGESSSIKAVFNSGGYKGKVTKAIYVYTNDPKNSEVVLMVSAEVDQPTANN